MKQLKTKIALIGGGNMGTAFVAGLLASRKISSSQICVSDVRQAGLRSLKLKYKVTTKTNTLDAIKNARVILLCVKPQQMESVLKTLNGNITPDQIVISIAAGITLPYIEKKLRSRVPVIRVMPNTPALYGAGAMVYSSGKWIKKTHENICKEILSSVGVVWKTEEKNMDAVTALSGSGPAYVFHLAENMIKAGCQLKLPATLTEALTRQTIYGAGLMLAKSKDRTADLRKRVTSPGGTTEAALKVMESKKISNIIEKALMAATQRSKELSGC